MEYIDGKISQINHGYGRLTPNKNCRQTSDIGGVIDVNKNYEGSAIDVNAIVNPNKNVNITATKSITLKPGFSTKNTFTAKIGNGCTDNAWIYEYAIKDHLGNTRLMIADDNKDGTITDSEIKSEYHYYPFGMEQKGKWQNRTRRDNKYRYNGKELHNELGLNLYAYGFRYYSPDIGRFTGTDPLAEKYPNISPYAYVANNPINAIDPDGRDIIVLNYGYTKDPEHWNNHAVGHQAVLIGNNKDGWTYYSYDADEGSNGRPGMRDDKSKNDNFTAGVHFASLEDFANSEHNTFKDDYDDGKGMATSHKNDDGNVIQRYQQGYRIEADPGTDKKMKSAANKTFDKKYSLFSGNQCTAVPRNALDAGGFNNGEYSDTGQRDPQNYGQTIKTKNILPVTKQKEIERSNVGTDVDSQLRRTQ